ncbi:CopM family metallochaperone [Methylobacterium sp. ID0610]|uniref:CopM family metallochaperone n=1 Tax=Methylobacterium carpenticola TaxID=3344827 RepID=UPI0036CEEC57
MPGMSGGHVASPAAQAYAFGLERMSRDMSAPMSGDADRDFATMMIPHHAGAVAMAKVELRHGRDPMLRSMAQAIVAAQDREIADLKTWLAKQ